MTGYSLDLAHPETVQVAVSINCDRLVVLAELEFYVGIAVGLEFLEEVAVLELYEYPLDIVCINHRMINCTDVYVEYAALYGCDRYMLLAACIDYIGNQLFHLLAAAYDRNACIMDLMDDIAAVCTTIELNFHFQILLFF